MAFVRHLIDNVGLASVPGSSFYARNRSGNQQVRFCFCKKEETLEKAVVAELLPRELRSLGFGILAFANALGDMAASLYVGFLLQSGHAHRAFTIAAAVGAAGSAWVLLLVRRIRRSALVEH